MVPLVFANKDEEVKIIKVVTDEKTKRHLENLGILANALITIIAINKGSVIIKVKDGRLALNQDIATKIFVE